MGSVNGVDSAKKLATTAGYNVFAIDNAGATSWGCTGCDFSLGGQAAGATGTPPNNPSTCHRLGGTGLMQARPAAARCPPAAKAFLYPPLHRLVSVPRSLPATHVLRPPATLASAMGLPLTRPAESSAAGQTGSRRGPPLGLHQVYALPSGAAGGMVAQQIAIAQASAPAGAPVKIGSVTNLVQEVQAAMPSSAPATAPAGPATTAAPVTAVWVRAPCPAAHPSADHGCSPDGC